MKDRRTKSRTTKKRRRVVTDLHRRLAAMGKTASWLSREFRVSRAAVSRWLSGDKKPRKSRIPKLAEKFGVDEMEMTYLIWPEKKHNPN